MKAYPLLDSFLAGAIMLAAWAIALFFFRFRKATGDRLFAWFGAAFLLMGVEWICGDFIQDKLQSNVYLIRLLAYLLILFAILDKNRTEKKP